MKKNLQKYNLWFISYKKYQQQVKWQKEAANKAATYYKKTVELEHELVLLTNYVSAPSLFNDIYTVKKGKYPGSSEDNIDRYFIRLTPKFPEFNLMIDKNYYDYIKTSPRGLRQVTEDFTQKVKELIKRSLQTELNKDG